MKQEIANNNDGFTLLELVMTIILIGIMSVGLYQVIIFGINDYMLNENALHQVNSMSYASSVIRKNLEEAAMPTQTINGSSNGQICPYSNSNSSSNNNPPIVAFNLANQLTACGSATESSGSATTPCNAVAFYKYISGTAGEQELVVFCVNNNILYKQVTTSINGTETTTAYPISDNISNIAF